MSNCPVSKDMQATYRLQMGPDLTFEQVRDLLPYFRDLGITHLYLSPCLQAAAGSTHGYDVVDPSKVDPRMGGIKGFEELCQASAGHGMGLVLDIVPNHMSIAGRQNRWWWDVLAKGSKSDYAGFFDIRWDHPDPLLRGKVMLPVLGDEFQRCLELRQIQIRRAGPEICLAYFEHEFPVSSRSLAGLTHAACETAAPDASIAAINADPLRLKAFLDLQHYRLAYWRQANRDLNYRRFFDIHQLAGVCVEKEAVFVATHELVLRWINAGKIQGLRIDHPDGLRDPTAYLERLRAAMPRAWVVVEKILAHGESLAAEWPVDGTTGYDFLNRVNELFVDRRGERPLTEFYEEFTGQPIDYGEIVSEKKLGALKLLFDSELSRLENLLKEIRRRYTGPASRSDAADRRALAEIIACFPVYRTYIRPGTGIVCSRDQSVVRQALAAAIRRQPDIAPETWRMIADILLLAHTGKTESDFVFRFQQLAGPIMAKGVEDTVFYCFNRLISLNEVGGNPDRFGISLDEFHEHCLCIQPQWPRTLSATATHDTKRGEDVRLRISLLSEIPEKWTAAVRRWSRMNARFRQGGFPDANTEYFLYQTLVGAWPIGCDRLVPVMLKAAREAKMHTSWMDPDPVFEEALCAFAEAVMEHADFTDELSDFLEPLAWPAMVASLSQTLIKCTAPGVPDIYQGAELWDRNLVDPDNRRPVDFALRRRKLAEIATLPISMILNRHAEGLPKLFLLQRVLTARKGVAEAFGPRGIYRPLDVKGKCAGHLVAFMRGEQGVTLAPRLVVSLAGDWKDTVVKLPAGNWENVFTRESFSGGLRKVSRLLDTFPVAMLVRKRINPV